MVSSGLSACLAPRIGPCWRRGWSTAAEKLEKKQRDGERVCGGSSEQNCGQNRARSRRTKGDRWVQREGGDAQHSVALGGADVLVDNQPSEVSPDDIETRAADVGGVMPAIAGPGLMLRDKRRVTELAESCFVALGRGGRMLIWNDKGG